MRPDSQQQTRRRRGGRRHNQGGPRNNSSSFEPVAKEPVKKPGFFARILAFFKRDKQESIPSKAYGRVIDTPNTASNGGSKTPPAKNGNGNGNGRKIAFDSKPLQQPKAARKPEMVEVTSSKLYVGNLSFDATESDLSELFAGVGSVQSAEVVSHRESQKSKGFAFVTMGSLDEAKRAVTELHDKEFMGRHLVVSGAKTNDVRDTR